MNTIEHLKTLGLKYNEDWRDLWVHYTWFQISFNKKSLISFEKDYFKYENRIIKKELKNEIPDNLLLILSTTNKFKNGWFAESYKNIFIQKTTLLAFRKHQVDISGNNNELYNNEIMQLRIDINELIKKL